MKKTWLFRKLNFNLRTEVILNISFLMLAAILLIGFTISKINERHVIQEKVRYGERMVQDFQTLLDFISRDKKKLNFDDPLFRKEIQDFVHLYIKEKAFHDLIVVDDQFNLIAKKKADLKPLPSIDPSLKKAIQTGELSTAIDQSGSFLSTSYKKLTIYSPLWHQGKIVGGVQMEVPIWDMMMNLLEWKRIILITIVFDAMVLIVFGSFLLSRVLVKPIKDLVRLTQKISEGDFSQKIEETSKNEIGQLIGSFNRMFDRLKENQESLENYLESLELANKKLKQAQEELIRTEKLASIGRFAAGVAHEVGNPLGAILGYTSILQKDGMNQEESRDYLKRIEKEIERINRIVRELLDFARPTKFEIKEVEINQLIENTLSLLSYQKNFKNIESRLELQSGLPKIKGDESQLSQVFMNIILNAVDAMPEGGTLTIQTRTHILKDVGEDRLQRIYLRRRSSDPMQSDYSHMRKVDPLVSLFKKFSGGDQLVKIRISDTGVGIKKENLENIFDPFFTTKAPDKGTGLGLSISLRIVESLGGEIRVASEVGKGTTFEVYFPVA
ncbi:MAG: HAMP domain-containing protein [Syntrophaceae bacterium]|nr:HAMP domain-containing protein [Syntrophaceae bacterium]